MPCWPVSPMSSPLTYAHCPAIVALLAKRPELMAVGVAPVLWAVTG